MDQKNPHENEPIVRDEKYMKMFDEWLQQKNAEQQQEAEQLDGTAAAFAESHAEAGQTMQPEEGTAPSNPSTWDGSFQTAGQPPKPPEPPKKKKGKAKRVWLLIGILVVGIAVGVLVTILCTSPSSLIPGMAPTQEQPQASQDNGQASETPNLDGETPTISDYNNPVPEIAESVSPGVVGVTASYTQQSQQPYGESSVVSSRGTGFIISTDGYIITNNHVIADGESFMVTMQDGTEHEAQLIGSDSTLDIAVLKIEAEGLTALSIGNSDNLQVGELVVAIGNPQGAGENLTGTVSVGYVSALHRELMFNNTRQEFIQTDAALNPGNSGGPLVNSDGEVIGVVTLKSLVSSVNSDGSTVDTEGIGFAIPINAAIEAATEIIETGSVSRPGIGVYCTFLDEETATQAGVVSGMYIRDFMEISPAHQAGMQAGDIITAYDGNPVETGDDLIEYIGSKEVGDQITLTVWRDGQEMEITITLADTNA